MMEYFRIKNWSKHQHYKDRRPPWIKLHNSLFEDYEFGKLTDKLKWHLVAIWLLASRSTTLHPDGDPTLPVDIQYLTKHTGMDSKIDLEPLFNAGFLIRYQVASKVIATCSSETETETETETDALSPFSPRKMVELWNKAVEFFSQNGTKPKTPKVRGLPKDRYKLCLDRIKDCELTEAKWKVVLNAIHSDDWLSGRKPSEKYPDWKATFDYVIRKSSTTMRLIEGYQREESA